MSPIRLSVAHNPEPWLRKACAGRCWDAWRISAGSLAAVRSLLAKFRDTAIAAELQVGDASRRGDLVALTGSHEAIGAAEDLLTDSLTH